MLFISSHVTSTYTALSPILQAIAASKLTPLTASRHTRTPSALATAVGGAPPVAASDRHKRTPSMPGLVSPLSISVVNNASATLDPRALMLGVPPQPSQSTATGEMDLRQQISVEASGLGGAGGSNSFNRSAPEPGSNADAPCLSPTGIDPLQWLFQELINLLLVLCQADGVVKGFVCTKDNLQQLLECLVKLQQPHLVKVVVLAFLHCPMHLHHLRIGRIFFSSPLYCHNCPLLPCFQCLSYPAPVIPLSVLS